MQQYLPSPITFLPPSSAEPSSRCALCQLFSTLLIAPTAFPLEDLLCSLVKFPMALVLVPSLLSPHLTCNHTHSGLTYPTPNTFLSS